MALTAPGTTSTSQELVASTCIEFAGSSEIAWLFARVSVPFDAIVYRKMPEPVLTYRKPPLGDTAIAEAPAAGKVVAGATVVNPADETVKAPIWFVVWFNT
jgi:hypothetical protein